MPHRNASVTENVRPSFALELTFSCARRTRAKIHFPLEYRKIKVLRLKPKLIFAVLFTFILPHLGYTATTKVSRFKMHVGEVDKDRIFNHSSIMFLIKLDATKLHSKQITEIKQRIQEGERLKLKFEMEAPKMTKEEQEKESGRIKQFMEKATEDKKSLEEEIEKIVRNRREFYEKRYHEAIQKVAQGMNLNLVIEKTALLYQEDQNNIQITDITNQVIEKMW